MASAGYSFDATLASVFVFALAVLILLYYLHRLKRRRQALESEVNARTPVEDRAFNEMQLARQAAARLEKDGVDVSTAKGLLARAQSLSDRGDSSGAFEAARAARDTLLVARTSGGTIPSGVLGRPSAADPAPVPPVTRRMLEPAPIPIPELPVARPGPAPAPTNGNNATTELPAASGRPRLPKNQLEARFELALLEEEVERQQKRPADSQAWAEAQGCARDARLAYDSRDFTEALRLALRGRRRLGSRVETIGQPTRAPIPERPSPSAPDRKSGPTNGGPPASSPGAATSVTCTRCGRPGRSEDRFCRGCGASLAALPCPACGAARLDATDRFCGVCGAPLG